MLLLDYRKHTLLENIDDIVRPQILYSCMLSCLAYQEPDFLYLKWDAYKDKEVSDQTSSNFYEKKEKCANKLFSGMQNMPIFYDGSINQKICRDAQAFLILKDGIQYVAFRGTSAISDIFTDFDFLQVNLDGFPPHKNVKIHRGFYMQFLSIKEDLFKDVDPSKPVVFCGHSLGAALSTLAAVVYGHLHKEADISCITFGSPRVGNSGFVELFNQTVKTSLRFVTQKDIVPMMSAVYEYIHVTEAFCLKDNHVFKEEGDAHWTLRAACSLAHLVKPFYMHSFNTYLNLIISLFT